MRRLAAFITMIVTVAISMLFSFQITWNNKNTSLEYGGGKEIVYHISQLEEGKKLEDVDVEQELYDRFKKADVSNATIDLVKSDNPEELSYEAHVKVGTKVKDEVNSITALLTISSNLTFCTSTDVCKTADEMLNETRAVTMYTEGNGAFPGLSVVKSVWDDLMSTANEIASEDESTEGEEEPKGRIYLWMNKTSEDSYKVAYDSNNPNYEMQKKVLTSFTSDNYQESYNAVAIQNDINSTEFGKYTTRSYIDALNSDALNFKIEKMYETNVEPTFGANALLFSFIGMIVIFIIGAAILSGVYGIPGLIASISTLATESVLMLIFSLLGFAISPAAFIGMLITMILGFTISVNYFERVKVELRKPRNIGKANKEGYKKSFLTTVDTCLIVTISALLTFVIGKGMVSILGAVTFIGALLTFVITNYLNKWFMFWFTSADNIKNKASIYGLSPKQFKLFEQQNTEETKVENGEQVQEAEKKTSGILKLKPKKKSIIFGSLAGSFGLIALVSTLAFGLSGNGAFNTENKDSISNYITLKFQVDDQESDTYKNILQTQDYFENYLMNTDDVRGDLDEFGDVKPSDIVHSTYHVEEEMSPFTKEITTYVYASYEVGKTDINRDYIEKLTTVCKQIDLESKDDTEKEMFSIVYGESKSVAKDYYLNSIYLVAGLSVLWSLIYVFARFGISAFTGHTVTTLGTMAFAIALLSLCRIPMNTMTAYALIALGLIMSFIYIPLFNRNNEIIKDKRLKKTATKEERALILNESLNYYFPILLTTTITSFVGFIGLMAFNGTFLVASSTVLIASIIMLSLFTLFFTTSIYYLVKVSSSITSFNEKVSESMKKRKKQGPSKREIRIQKYNEEEAKQPHETIIVGINDFR